MAEHVGILKQNQTVSTCVLYLCQNLLVSQFLLNSAALQNMDSMTALNNLSLNFGFLQ